MHGEGKDNTNYVVDWVYRGPTNDTTKLNTYVFGGVRAYGGGMLRGGSMSPPFDCRMIPMFVVTPPLTLEILGGFIRFRMVKFKPP